MGEENPMEGSAAQLRYRPDSFNCPQRHGFWQQHLEGGCLHQQSKMGSSRNSLKGGNQGIRILELRVDGRAHIVLSLDGDIACEGKQYGRAFNSPSGFVTLITGIPREIESRAGNRGRQRRQLPRVRNEGEAQ